MSCGFESVVYSKTKRKCTTGDFPNWWAERGWVFKDEGLDQVVRYTLDGQDWKPET